MDKMKINELLATAEKLVAKRSDDINHTVAASVLTKSGEIISSMNFYHFTGGPCAEVAALARVVSEGEEPIAVVAVGNNNRGVISPCGRCRQTIFDYYPNMEIVITNDGDTKAIKELLPNIYSWNDQ